MGLHDDIISYEWNGLQRYRCPVCQLDSASHLDIRLHINASHVAELMAAAGVRQPEATLFGASGELITEVPLSENETAEQAKKENE